MKIENGRAVLSETELILFVDWCGFRHIPENSVDRITIGETVYTKESFSSYIREFAECGCDLCMGNLVDRLVKCIIVLKYASEWGVRGMTEVYAPKVNSWIEQAELIRQSITHECVRKKKQSKHSGL